MSVATPTESATERTVREEQEAHEIAEANAKGKLVEVPRVKVVIDEADPNILKLAFTGGVDGERSDPDWVRFFNSLTEGKNHDISLQVFVKGSKKTHRRDSEGEVDAVVHTKTLLVHSIDYAD